MSIRYLNAAFRAPDSITGAKRLVLLALADAANDEGYCWPKRETIAAKAGIRRLDTVTEHLTALEEEGWIDRKINEWSGMTGDIPVGKRPNVYRMTFDEAGPMGPRIPGRGAPRIPGSHGSADSGEQNHHPEPPQEPTTPTPPEEGTSSTLFTPPPEKRSEKVKRSGKTLDPITEAQFRSWWDRYPRKGRGGPGSIDRARRAWILEVRAGATAAELDRQLSNYRSARATFEALTGDPCWLLAAPKFLKERRQEFDHELDEQEVRDHWNIRASQDRKPPAAVTMDRAALIEWLGANETRRREIEASVEEVAAHG